MESKLSFAKIVSVGGSQQIKIINSNLTVFIQQEFNNFERFLIDKFIQFHIKSKITGTTFIAFVLDMKINKELIETNTYDQYMLIRCLKNNNEMYWYFFRTAYFGIMSKGSHILCLKKYFVEGKFTLPVNSESSVYLDEILKQWNLKLIDNFVDNISAKEVTINDMYHTERNTDLVWIDKFEFGYIFDWYSK